MTDILRNIPRYNLRTVLIVVAGVLVALNLYSWLVDRHQAMIAEIESNVVRLESYQRQKGMLDSLAKREDALREKAAAIRKRLFVGKGEAEIASAMQIKLQGMVMASGIESESIRPVPASVKSGEKEEATVLPLVVKMRLTGTLPEFFEFLQRLYGDEKFFRIESMTIRSYKKAGLKIFLEIRGYYQLDTGRADGGLNEAAG